MPETDTALSFAEATSPKVLAMYGGTHGKGSDPSVMILTFPDMLSAASWASTCGLAAQTWLGRMWAGFDSLVTVEVMHPDA